MPINTQVVVPAQVKLPGSSLSADEIAVLLGFANAAAMVAASVQYVLATGGTTNYVASPALALTPVNGTRIAVRFPSNCAANATLNVSGSGAKAIMLRTLTGERATAADDLLSGGTYIFTYMEDFGGLWISTGGAHLKAADIPSTLNGTTFNSYVQTGTAYIDSGRLLNTGVAGSTTVAGGNTGAQSAGAFEVLYGNSHPSKAGIVERYCGTAAGAAHSFFDKNGAVALTINEDGINVADRIFCGVIEPYGSGHGLEIRNISNNQSIKTIAGSSNNFANGAGSEYFGHQHGTYPGAHQQFAPLTTRAASTAFAVCPVATGDITDVLVQTSGGGASGAWIHVDSAGTLSLRNPPGITIGSEWVASSSPGASEYGAYVSAGVLYIKPGASLSYKISTFSFIGKA